MTDPMRLAAPSTRAHVLVGLVLGAASVAALLAGRLAISVFVTVVAVAAYADLRRLLAEWGHVVTFVLGALGVVAFAWTGYAARLALMPWTAAALIGVLLVSRVLVHEAGARVNGVTGDVAATLGASAAAGILAAHVLLIRSVPRFGFRGVLFFGLAVLLNDAAAFIVGRWRGRRQVAPAISPNKSWEGALAGFAVSVIVGLVCGLTLRPPFGVRSGLALGAAMGVLAPLGDLSFSTIKRSARVKGSGSYLGPLGGGLDAIDGILFAAPGFYWAFRTIAL